jgi:hypothetical protein
MLKEMRNKTIATRPKSGTFNLTDQKSAKIKETEDKSLATTFHKSTRSKDDNEIIDSIKNFVDNSKTVKAVEKETPVKHRTYKEYLNTVSSINQNNENSILNSIFHENKFTNSLRKKSPSHKKIRQGSYFDYKPIVIPEKSNFNFNFIIINRK